MQNIVHQQSSSYFLSLRGPLNIDGAENQFKNDPVFFIEVNGTNDMTVHIMLLSDGF